MSPEDLLSQGYGRWIIHILVVDACVQNRILDRQHRHRDQEDRVILHSEAPPVVEDLFSNLSLIYRKYR